MFGLHWQTHCNFRKREDWLVTLTGDEKCRSSFPERLTEFSGGRASPCEMAKPLLPSFRRNRHRPGHGLEIPTFSRNALNRLMAAVSLFYIRQMTIITGS